MIGENIIIPMNSKGDYSGGSTPGSIIAQKWFADKKGKVIVSFDKGCKYSNSAEKPSIGFFRETPGGQVTYRFIVEDILDEFAAVSHLESSSALWNKDFLPPWRMELYDEARIKPARNRTWILISDIRKLKEPKGIDYFDKKPSQSFVYSSKGADLEHSNERVTPEEFIDDTIFNTMRHKTSFTEDELELIIWAWLVKNNCEYVKRQRIPEGTNRRIDLVIKSSKGEFLVIELKRDTATIDTLLDQLIPYVNLEKKERGLETLRGMIVARDASPELINELEKPENKNKFSFVPYGFSFKFNDAPNFF